jgi:hypothetical protein
MPSRRSPGPRRCSPISSRYTHRVAISNSRLIASTSAASPSATRTTAATARIAHKVMTLAPDEFIRRFLLHVLPKGFHRIRHYGLLASAACKANIARARELIAMPRRSTDPSAEHDDADPAASIAADHRPPCPCCGGRMIIVETFERCGAPRAPPSPDAGVRTATP